MSLFFALWPDESFRQQLADTCEQLKQQHKGVAGGWFGTDSYHITVQDISLHPDKIEQALLAAAGVQAPAVEVRLHQASSFKHPRGHYRWMLSSKNLPGGLKDLRRELLAQLRQQGIAPRPTSDKPHVTLHYHAERQLPERQLTELPFTELAWTAPEFVLLQGETQAGRGFQYRVLGRWPLSAAERDPGHSPQLDLWDNPG